MFGSQDRMLTAAVAPRSVAPTGATDEPGQARGPVDDRDSPCGWFESSLELATGLQVAEIDDHSSCLAGPIGPHRTWPDAT